MTMSNGVSCSQVIEPKLYVAELQESSQSEETDVSK